MTKLFLAAISAFSLSTMAIELKCNSDDFIKNFSVEPAKGYITNKDKEVTGQKVFLYKLDSKGKKVEVGEMVYRPKQGPTGKTNYTIQWSKPMQKCFKKNNRSARESKNESLERNVYGLILEVMKKG